MKKTFYIALILLIVAILILAAVVVLTIWQKGNLAQGNTNVAGIFGEQKISDQSAGAFGDLAVSSGADIRGGKMTSETTMPTEADQNTNISNTNTNATADGEDSIEPDIKIEPYVYKQYKYVYKGQGFNFSGTTVDVLKRTTSTQLAKDLARSFINLNIGGADLSSFEDVAASYLTFNEDKDGGYIISLDTKNGTLSIYQNYYFYGSAVPTEERSYSKENWQSFADQDAPEIVGNFIKDHGISFANYGQPQTPPWQQMMLKEGTDDSAAVQFPNTITLVYPLLISGKNVYSEDGSLYGVSVEVNIAKEEVTSLSSIERQEYQSSSYPAETSQENILKIAQQGGVYGTYFDPNAQIVEITLGEPSVAYAKFWKYEDNGSSSELYVPSLIFPIQNVPTGETIYQQNVVVPLAKDLVDLYIGQIGLPTEEIININQ